MQSVRKSACAWGGGSDRFPLPTPKTEHLYPANFAQRITGIDLRVNDRSREVARSLGVVSGWIKSPPLESHSTRLVLSAQRW